MLDENALAAKLADLGDFADDIAHNLGELGIKGVCGDPLYCPMAKYIQAFLGPDYKVFVQDSWAEIYEGAIGGAHTEVRLSTTCMNFVRLFDEGRYAALQEEVRNELSDV
jgi:hypothetical protein